MTTTAQMQAKVTKFETNMDVVDTFTNGDVNATATTDNGTISSLAKLQADAQSAVIADGAISERTLQSEILQPQHLRMTIGGGRPLSFAFDDADMWTPDPGAGISFTDGDATFAAAHILATFGGSASDAFQSLRTTALNSPKIAAGQAIRFRAHLIAQGSPTDQFRVQISWRDASFAEISSTFADVTASDFVATGAASIEATAPSGSRRAQLICTRVGANTTGDWLLGDADVEFVDVVSQADAESGSGSNKIDLSLDRLQQAIAARGNGVLFNQIPARTMTGTSQQWTGLSGVRQIVVNFHALSLATSGSIIVQLGDVGGFETTGYLSAARNGASEFTSNVGFIIPPPSVSATLSGCLIITEAHGNRWHAVLGGYETGGPSAFAGGGYKGLTAPLDRIRILTTASQNFDNGIVMMNLILGVAS